MNILFTLVFIFYHKNSVPLENDSYWMNELTFATENDST